MVTAGERNDSEVDVACVRATNEHVELLAHHTSTSNLSQ